MDKIKELMGKKTTWVGIAGIGYGAYLVIATGNFDLGIAAIIAGLGAITGRDAIAKVEASVNKK